MGTYDCNEAIGDFIKATGEEYGWNGNLLGTLTRGFPGTFCKEEFHWYLVGHSLSIQITAYKLLLIKLVDLTHPNSLNEIRDYLK